MVFVPHHANITLPRAKTLINGGTVSIPHSHLVGEHGIFLTQQQAKRWKKAHAAGKGVRLRMSHAQLRHNIRGGGFLSTAWTQLKELGKKVGPALVSKAKEVGKDLAKKAIDKGLEHLPGLLEKVDDKLHSKLNLNAKEGGSRSALQELGSKAVKAGLGKAADLARIGAHKTQQRLGKKAGMGVKRMRIA